MNSKKKANPLKRCPGCGNTTGITIYKKVELSEVDQSGFRKISMMLTEVNDLLETLPSDVDWFVDLVKENVALQIEHFEHARDKKASELIGDGPKDASLVYCLETGCLYLYKDHLHVEQN